MGFLGKSTAATTESTTRGNTEQRNALALCAVEGPHYNVAVVFAVMQGGGGGNSSSR